MELYRRQKRYLEINNLIYKALDNITKIYNNIDHPDVTDIDEYINEYIKGIYITDINVEFMYIDLIPKHRLLFYIITMPFFDFYRFVKKVILRLIN
jgi:hypothetical protein